MCTQTHLHTHTHTHTHTCAYTHVPTHTRAYTHIIYLHTLHITRTCVYMQGSIDSTRVTCVKWVPGSDHQFVSSHRSGHLYIWSSIYSGKTNGPQSFVHHKEITDAKICTVKPKSKSPILFRWTIGHGAINAFAFSPDANHIAIASQDGFLRVYDFHKQEIYGRMRSYFGGLLCVCWSPDGKYAVTGGEDDLVNVWSFEQKRVVARGEGHKSYINAVAFDPHMTTLPDPEMISPTLSVLPTAKETESGDTTSTTLPTNLSTKAQSTSESPTLQSHSKSTLDSSSTHQLNRYLSKVGTELELNITAYRLGSVGQDTQLCLWDLSGDVLKPRRPFLRNRSQMSRHSRPVSMVDPVIDQNEPSSIPASSATTTATETPSTTSQQPNGPDPSGSLNTSKLPNRTANPGEDADSATAIAPVGNHVDTSVKRTSLSSNRDSNAETGPLEHETTGGEKIPTSVTLPVPPDDGRSSTPSTVSTSSEKGNGKKEKKHKKEKNKDKSKAKSSSPKHNNPSGNSNEGEKWVPKKSHRKSITKMIKFVSNIGTGNSHVQHSYRRAVAAFETCKSDDIAPKMSEVNLIEPLVAKKISNERLTALVFQRDCIITACQEGFIHTWSRPGAELPGQTQPDDKQQQSKEEPVASSVPSNPGVSCVLN